ncbi:MAG TPA: SGNH/GDSL hydrolase family protein [Denitromonas sp.]|uniref:SGNH/GDSL hydrolase family protein n=1 Tax=Denitromonas sp. TaxID=2734609 RepID=UPI001DC8BB95|nr:SGNH/GDSL hydrolase family protein [Rhodocyclaceae bacterium]MCP5220799.1 SGNH/GDSL hydrolase family protein [Zoogloeaceae bacterium]HPR07016.1 SGNH/GDSL hydrolase family protein [Denitromonas sp.]HQU88823.1 SGNH/GDSL hydrolase family protein [Denitromonas sp.]HQV15022.1 SGNH/GDSL hydrolase family protein [Denitromonas sp.]
MIGIRHLGAALVLTAACTMANAGWSSLVVIGDSLSDNGNVSALTGGALPPAPYVGGRFSNGPVAAEYMAASLGIGLQDFAHGGAKTGVDIVGNDSYLWSLGLNGTGMGAQVGMFAASLGGAAADANALYMVWGGPNDFFEPTMSPAMSAANIGSVISGLYGLGARSFFVPNMPDLGRTPEFLGTALAGTMTGATLAFNALLDAEVMSLGLALPDASFIQFDTFNFFSEVLARPGDFGMMNVTGACIDSLACLTSPTEQMTTLFWDGVHPTTTAHAALGLAFARSVPEPTTAWLVFGVLGMMGWMRGRRSA